jgi:hypothetical protein
MILLFTACGERKEFLKHQGNKPSFLPGHILSHGKFKQLQGATDYLDYDNDSIQDDLDDDIDNDGVTNFLDQYPFDESKKGPDADFDGIPDFLDFYTGKPEKGNIEFEKIWIQKSLYKRKGIVLAENGNKFSLSELRTIWKYFSEGPLRNWEFKNLAVIIRDADQDNYHADFYHYWKSISLHHVKYLNEAHNFRETLTHESFHALASDVPDFFREFTEEAGWIAAVEEGVRGFYFQNENKIKEFIAASDFKYNFDSVKNILQSSYFPSDYAKAGPDEMFAECGTATVLINQGRSDYNKNRYYNLKKFKSTPIYSKINKLLSDKI